MSTLDEMPPIPPKPLDGQRRSLGRRLVRGVSNLRKRRVTVLKIDDPARPARPYEYSHLGVTILTGALIASVATVGIRMADYDAKRTALQRQTALTAQLMEKQSELLNERDAQMRRLVDLARRVQQLQQELTTIRAFRQKVQKLLSDGPAAVSFGPENSRADAAGPDEQLAMGGGHPNEQELLEWAKTELSQAHERAAELSRQMEQLEGDVRAFNRKLNHTPSIWPVEGRITSTYGYRIHPITEERIMHDGLDIAVQTGTPVHATADGKVIRAGRYGGYGLAVEIDHDYGIRTLYGHNSRLAVKVGDVVRKGEVIAYAGSTGLSTGPHVHYQVTVNRRTVNPYRYLPDHD